VQSWAHEPVHQPARENAIARRSKRAAPEVEALLTLIRTTLDDHKAIDVAVIDLIGKSSIGDYMVVASGASSRQVVALADSLVEALKAHGLKGIVPEGMTQGDWVLIDAGDVIVHLFRPEVRQFYGLEKMWQAELGEEALAEPARRSRR
jgi:ribosome-associated protein